MILGIILIVLGVALLIIETILRNLDAKEVFIGAVIGIFIYCGGWLMSNHNAIRPLDVYEGKTTLKYTIIDSVKVDSTVVWKPEYK